jgi:hypothetical protein
MEKVTLKLAEFYQLDTELNGAINQQTGEVLAKGLLSEKIKLTTKYWLNDLSKKVSSEKESVEKLKILVESDVLVGSKFIDLDQGQESLGEMEKELDKLLNL